MEYTIKDFNNLPDDALNLRKKVFVEEQGFCDEFDEIDKRAIHFVLYENKNPIATCRIFVGEAKETYILGRLCVLKEYRGKGIGSKILRAAEDKVKVLGGKKLSLHSQYQARDFYKKLGFAEYGEIEYEQHCPHIWLAKMY